MHHLDRVTIGDQPRLDCSLQTISRHVTRLHDAGHLSPDVVTTSETEYIGYIVTNQGRQHLADLRTALLRQAAAHLYPDEPLTTIETAFLRHLVAKACRPPDNLDRDQLLVTAAVHCAAQIDGDAVAATVDHCLYDCRPP